MQYLTCSGTSTVGVSRPGAINLMSLYTAGVAEKHLQQQRHLCYSDVKQFGCGYTRIPTQTQDPSVSSPAL